MVDFGIIIVTSKNKCKKPNQFGGRKPTNYICIYFSFLIFSKIPSSNLNTNTLLLPSSYISKKLSDFTRYQENILIYFKMGFCADMR